MKTYRDQDGNVVNVIKVGKNMRNNASLYARNQNSFLKATKKVNNYTSKLFLKNFDARMTDEKAQTLIQTAVKNVSIFFNEFDEVSNVVIGGLAKEADTMVKRQLKLLGVNLLNVPSMSFATKKLALNSALGLRKISEEHAKSVGDLFLDTLKNGNGLKDFTEKIGDLEIETLRGAEREALNVSRSAFSAMSRDALQSHGVTNGIWNHMGGSMNPRPSHEAMDRKVFTLSSPPVNCGYPGEWDGCHCTVTPVVKI